MAINDDIKGSEKGILTVEATITICAFMMFMMFMLNFGQLYRVQNYVAHRTLDAGRMLSFCSYDYENSTESSNIMSFLTSILTMSLGTDNLYKTGYIEDAVRSAIKAETNLNASLSGEGASISLFNSTVDEQLRAMGVQNGLGGLEIEASEIDGDIDIKVTYKVELIFKFFGISEATMHQHVRCALWK